MNRNIGTENVINTNFCEISICKLKNKRKILILSAIDNLVKGAAGQAIQNMNILKGFKENLGLKWKIYFFYFFFLAHCSSITGDKTQKIYICGDHECADKKEINNELNINNKKNVYDSNKVNHTHKYVVNKVFE